MTPRLSHLPALDGLRAVAITAVLFTHAWTYPTTTPLLNRLAAAGWIGVDLFFVLSGFLITRILLASRDRDDYYRRFYLRRTRRIFPAYYLLLAVVFLVLPHLSQSAELRAATSDWLYYLTYLSNIRLAQVGWQVFLLDITWSLAVEEQFYAVWPWLVKQCTPDRLRRVAWLLVLGVPLLRLGALLGGWPSRAWLDLFTLFRLDSFAAGAVLAVRESRLRTFGRREAGLLAGGGSALLALILTGTFGRQSVVVITVGHSLLALVSALAIRATFDTRSRLARALAWRPFQAVGRVSYGLYLYHPLTMAVLGTVVARAGIQLTHLSGRPVLDGWLHLSAVGIAAYGLAVLSHRYYETPLLEGRRATRDRLDAVHVGAVEL